VFAAPGDDATAGLAGAAAVALADEAAANFANTTNRDPQLDSTASLGVEDIVSPMNEREESSPDADAPDDDTTTSTIAVSPASVEPEERFDLAAELADALDDTDEQTNPVSAPVSASDDAFSAVFREFKRGVKRVIGTGDYRTHYDLGIAYREMGLLDDASGEFAEAANAPDLRLSSLHLLGLCALESKRPNDAVAHFGQALSLPEVPDEQLPALRFDLARAHAALGDVATALSLLDAVAQCEAEFPGLVEFRATLVTQPASAPSSDDGEPLERFDDLIADAESAASRDVEAAARVATTGAETPAPPAQPPTADGGPAPRRRKFSFL
jgi:hypothetical protein